MPESATHEFLYSGNNPNDINNSELLDTFRQLYRHYERRVQAITPSSTDSTVLARLGDELNEYKRQLDEHNQIFDNDEFTIIQQNLSVMLGDLRLFYDQALDRSHHGRPTVIQAVHTGRRGRPRIVIDPDFLRWAYAHRSTTGIARFLGVNRDTVRNALLEYGIAEPQENPFRGEPSPEQEHHSGVDSESEDDLLDPDLPLPEQLPSDINLLSQQAPSNAANTVVSYTGPLSGISDEELDNFIARLRAHYRRAGISMLNGMLRRLGLRITRERIRASLMRVDPVQRVFQRIRIRRRVYSVAGPMALWHHDGQHGLIRWGLVIHGFIDGYSRLITGLRASDNNYGETVLNLFHEAAQIFGVPSRVRGDHGVENIRLAAWMELHRGERRGSYIWGRSVHNVRIERLWVDVTAQVGATWADLFTQFELHCGLDINNVHHLLLLHYLFLPAVNSELTFFAESWNQHKIQIRDGPNRSPADLFGFDMIVHGVRGDQLPSEELGEEELEVYGVDWEGLRDDRLLRSQRENNDSGEGASSWVGRTGLPDHLNEVPVHTPISNHLSLEELEGIYETLDPWLQGADDIDRRSLWLEALAHARSLRSDLF